MNSSPGEQLQQCKGLKVERYQECWEEALWLERQREEDVIHL